MGAWPPTACRPLTSIERKTTTWLSSLPPLMYACPLLSTRDLEAEAVYAAGPNRTLRPFKGDRGSEDHQWRPQARGHQHRPGRQRVGRAMGAVPSSTPEPCSGNLTSRRDAVVSRSDVQVRRRPFCNRYTAIRRIGFLSRHGPRVRVPGDERERFRRQRPRSSERGRTKLDLRGRRRRRRLAGIVERLLISLHSSAHHRVL